MGVRLQGACAFLAILTPLLTAQQAAVVQPSVSPTNRVPLTASEKFAVAGKDIVSPLGILDSAFSGALDQWSDFPQGWGQGWEAYGQRVGSRWARRALRTGLGVSLAVPLKIDPRYDLSENRGIGARVGHAFRRTLIARRDDGREMVNIPTIAGVLGTSAISLQWYPERYRTASHILGLGGQDLALEFGNNLMREFWPDIKRKLLRR